MKNLLKSILIITFASFIVACSDAPSDEIVSSTDVNEISNPSKDEFLVIEIDTKVKDPELQKLIDQSISEYKVIVKTTRENFAAHKEEIKKDIQANIEEIKTAHKEQEAAYKKECSEINEQNADSCNDFGTQTHSLKEQYQELEVELKNRIKEIDNKELNTLSKYKADMKNNVGKLKIQDQ